MLNRKEKKVLLIASGIVMLTYLSIALYFGYESTLVEVTTWRHGPAVAATDLEGFKRQMALEGKAGLGLAENSFRVPEGTRARGPIMGVDSNFPAVEEAMRSRLSFWMARGQDKPCGYAAIMSGQLWRRSKIRTCAALAP
jgi:hypothetical protein